RPRPYWGPVTGDRLLGTGYWGPVTGDRLLGTQRHPDGAGLDLAGVAPGVRLVALEVQGAPRLDRVLLPGHGELEHAARDVHALPPRGLRRLAPAPGPRRHAGPGAGQQEPAVRSGNA